jgi:hypothetical protein
MAGERRGHGMLCVNRPLEVVSGICHETCYPKNNFHVGYPVVFVNFLGPLR